MNRIINYHHQVSILCNLKNVQQLQEQIMKSTCRNWNIFYYHINSKRPTFFLDNVPWELTKREWFVSRFANKEKKEKSNRSIIHSKSVNKKNFFYLI